MSRVKKLNVTLWKIKRKIKDAIEFEWALIGVTERKWFRVMRLKKGEVYKVNPWIEYVSKHTALSYATTISLFGKCTSLPIKLTRRKAKALTKLMIEQSAAGVAWVIDPAMMAATIKAREE